MVDITPAPKLVNNIYFKLGASTYSKAITDVNLPGLDPIIFQGGTEDAAYGDMPVGGRKLNITAVQDWETTASLCNYLLAHEGERVTVIFSPRAAGTAYFSVDVILAAPTIGGPINKFGEFTKALPCVSKPVKVDAPA